MTKDKIIINGKKWHTVSRKEYENCGNTDRMERFDSKKGGWIFYLLDRNFCSKCGQEIK